MIEVLLAAKELNENYLSAAGVALVIALAFVLAGAFAPFSRAGKLRLVGIGAVACTVALTLIWLS